MGGGSVGNYILDMVNWRCGGIVADRDRDQVVGKSGSEKLRQTGRVF